MPRGVARERGGLEVQAPPRFVLHRLEVAAPHALADLPFGAPEVDGRFPRAAQAPVCGANRRGDTRGRPVRQFKAAMLAELQVPQRLVQRAALECFAGRIQLEQDFAAVTVHALRAPESLAHDWRLHPENHPRTTNQRRPKAV